MNGSTMTLPTPTPPTQGTGLDIQEQASEALHQLLFIALLDREGWIVENLGVPDNWRDFAYHFAMEELSSELWEESQGAIEHFLTSINGALEWRQSHP